MVTITAETTELQCPVEELLRQVERTAGVVRAEIVAG